MKNTRTGHIIALLVLAAFLAVAFLMPVGMLSMEHHEGIPMSNCPFMFGEEAICAMSVFEHISLWQALMRAIPYEIVGLMLLFTCVVIGFLRHLFDPPDVILSRRSLPLWHSTISSPAALLLGSVINPCAP